MCSKFILHVIIRCVSQYGVASEFTCVVGVVMCNFWAMQMSNAPHDRQQSECQGQKMFSDVSQCQVNSMCLKPYYSTTVAQAENLAVLCRWPPSSQRIMCRAQGHPGI